MTAEQEQLARDPVADWIARAALARGTRGAASRGQRIVFGASDVWIDYLTGNDAADGLSPATAWKTNAPLYAAVGIYGVLSPPGSGARWFTIHYVGAVPPDLLQVQAVLAPNVCLRIVVDDALPTVLRTGTITAATPYTNSDVLASITDPTVADWTPYLNKRIRWTSGAAAGAQTVIAANVGGGVARIGNPGRLSDVVVTGATFPTLVPPSTGTYVVESLPTVQLGHFDVQATNNGNAIEPFVNFIGCDMAAAGPIGADPQGTGSTITYVLQGCSCEWQTIQGTALIACLSVFPRGLQLFVGTAFDAAGCVFKIFFQYTFGSTGTLLGFNLFEGVGIQAIQGGSILIQDNAIENAPGDAIAATGSMSFPSGKIEFSAPTGIVGSNNGGVGVRCPPGQSTVCRGALPKVSGAGGDLALGAATTGEAWDDTAAAYIAPKRALTWALVATSVAGGGFGGQAADVRHQTFFIGPDV